MSTVRAQEVFVVSERRGEEWPVRAVAIYTGEPGALCFTVEARAPGRPRHEDALANNEKED